LALCAVGGAVIACSAGSRSSDVSWGPPAEARTRAVLVGELCERGEPCECRDQGAPGTGGVSGPDGSTPSVVAREGDSPAAVESKRIELRLRSSHALWLQLGEWTFYKDRERLEACFYIDLPAPGIGERAKAYPLELRASNADGVSAEVAIHELGVVRRTWYQTFGLSCGLPGACSFEELEEIKADAARAVREHKLYDPCGSIRVKGLHWDSRVAPDHEHPGDLAVRLILEVFRFTPDKPHGDPNCSIQ
jgi:hypothetical protein